MQQNAHGGVAAPSATSLFPINYSPTKCLQNRNCSRCDGGLVREQLPCIPPGTLWPPFINVPKVEAWQAARTAFDLDAGRKVEYEPEMTSQARSVERMNHEDLYVSVLGPHVCRDPSYYARAAETATSTVTNICHICPFKKNKYKKAVFQLYKITLTVVNVINVMRRTAIKTDKHKDGCAYSCIYR